jgi:4-amino-4-deoxy-L-arabinose transferase-like glycosyltransferase
MSTRPQHDHSGDVLSPITAAGAQEASLVRRTAVQPWAVLLALAAIVGLNVAGSLWWVQRNAVLLGHDATAYLGTTLEYAAFLTRLTPQTVFAAFTYPPYRTPGLFIAAQPFLRVFGANMDGAQLLNVALLGVVVALTYALARRVAGTAAALFAAALTGLFPMLAGMARLYYTEMFLTAMVVLALLALDRSDGFARRGWALAWGAAVGVGLLVKWTMPIYLALPTLWVLWQGRAWRRTESEPQAGGTVRAALLAAGIGLIGSALWFWPNRAALQTTPAGEWSFLIWALLIGALAFCLLRPASRPGNVAAALLLAALIASLWYLPHADFATRLLAVDAERSQETIGTLGSGNYRRYLRYIYRAHFGPLAFWAFVPAVLALWAWAALRRRELVARTVWLWLSLLSAFGVLSLLSQANERNLVPLLPVIAVLAAAGLWAAPPAVRWSVGAIWLAVLGLQWAIFTFDMLGPLRAGREALWARSGYSAPPASAETDPGYWIGPDVLARLATDGGGPASLALLVNTEQLHRGVLNYLTAVNGQSVEINDVTEARAQGWAAVIGSRWVLLKDGDNREVEGEGAALAERILAGDPLFDALYDEAARYPLPNGETVTLFQRTAGPGHPQADPARVEEARAVADAIRAAWSDHATLVYATSDAAVWVGMHDPPVERFVLPDREPGALSRLEGTVLLVLDAASEEMTPGGDWLRAASAGGDRVWLEVWGRPHALLQPMDAAGEWGETLRLAGARSLDAAQPGEVLPVELDFAGGIPPGWKASLRLVDESGGVLASNDLPLGVTVRAGLLLPPGAAAGTAVVALVVYDESTLEPVPDATAQEQTPLFPVRVTTTATNGIN